MMMIIVIIIVFIIIAIGNTASTMALTMPHATRAHAYCIYAHVTFWLKSFVPPARP